MSRICRARQKNVSVISPKIRVVSIHSYDFDSEDRDIREIETRF